MLFKCWLKGINNHFYPKATLFNWLLCISINNIGDIDTLNWLKIVVSCLCYHYSYYDKCALLEKKCKEKRV